MAEQPTNDLNVISVVLGGDTNAYGSLIDKYQDRVFNLVYRMARDRHEAEDITHEAFIKSFRELKSFKVKNDFYPWICSIALNLTRNRLRRKSILKFFSLDKPKETGEGELAWEIEDGTLTPEKQLIKEEESGRINLAVSALPVKYREVFLLRNMDGMSYAEISAATGLPMGTVMTRLHRGSKLAEKAFREIFPEMK